MNARNFAPVRINTTLFRTVSILVLVVTALIVNSNASVARAEQGRVSSGRAGLTRFSEMAVDWSRFVYNKNVAYHYSIKYPQDWGFVTVPDGVDDIGVVSFESKGGSYIYSRATILREGGWSYEDTVKNAMSYLDHPSRLPGVLDGQCTDIIKGTASTINVNADEAGRYEEIVFLERNGAVYELRLVEAPNEEITEAFRSFVSTLDFTYTGPATESTGSGIPFTQQPELNCPPVDTTGYPPSGSVLVSGSSWNGVNVYSNGGNVNNGCPDTYGYRWQCVELDQRFYAQHFGGPNQWSGISYAYQMFDTHPSTLSAIANGGSPGPAWGDLLIFNGGCCGHAAVITSVSGGMVNFVEENWSPSSSYGRWSLAIDGSNHIANRGSYTVRGWLRHGGPTPTPTPNPTATYTPTPGGGSFTLSNPTYNVQPNQQFNVSVHLHSSTFTFRESSGDHLHCNPENQCYGAYPVQPIRGTVGPGQDFDFNDSSFRMTAPGSTGTYHSHWQMRVGGNQIGPVSDITINVAAATPPPSCSFDANRIVLYADTNYGGACVALSVGDCPNPGCLSPVGNDNIESIRVGGNVQAVLCENDNYQGRCQTFTADNPNLNNEPIGGNNVSSVRVQWRPPTSTPAPNNTPVNTDTPLPSNTPINTGTRFPTNTPVNTGIPLPTNTSIGCNITFTDTHPTDYFYTAVSYLYCLGAISGYSDNTFRPFNDTTRGQLSKIIVLSLGWIVNCPSTGHFSDVLPGSAFFCFVETAYSHGIISGYTGGTFRPNAQVTRGQLSKIIVLAMGWADACPASGHFSDVAVGSAFFCFVETAYHHTVISGYGDGTFRPGNNATRGQICKIVYSAITSH